MDVVSLLLEYKPNVNALDKDGCSALTIACKEGYQEIANALMTAGAYINLQVGAKPIPLSNAAQLSESPKGCWPKYVIEIS